MEVLKMLKNQNLLSDIASFKGLQGNDLRVIMFCYKRDVMQKDIQEGLGMKKTNCSTIVNKLTKLGILERASMYNTNFYRVNESWTSDQIPGQMNIKDFA